MLMNRFNLKVVLCLCVFTLIFQVSVYANSSWQWLTSSPKELLPLAIGITLFIEIVAILFLSSLGKDLSIKVKAVVLIILANIMSFLFPYVWRMFEMQPFATDLADAWYLAFQSGPYYIVLLGYLFLTIIIEAPIIYYLLKKHAANAKRLLIVIIVSNVITTSIVAILERTLLQGTW
ncbi:hypothetical protein [Alkalihalobacterium bogoriense]|uniref:hypothetical protein n=1 Tax=Alkalihalobacterium bogoriense TaxID=246272 RepID=UPI000AB3A873|nr:hypothetical protein [Alkalihalobacterium bogoriense]